MGRAGGGGRSSGSGGGRSSGSRRSSSGRSTSSFGGSNSSSLFGGSNNSYANRRSTHSSSLTSRLSGGFALLVIVIIFAIELSSANRHGDSNGRGSITPSTISREALPKGSVVETNYYTDELGWIQNSTELVSGMRDFYQRTGVQPYFYLTDNINGNNKPMDAEAEAWMEDFYDKTFQDEAHTLLLFLEYNEQYAMWYLNGRQAKTVMDMEAMDILMDNIVKYYYTDLNEEQLFSKAYSDTGIRIMEITKEPFPWYGYIVIVGIIIIVILVIVFIWKAVKHQKNVEAENTARILNTPIEMLQSETAKDLSKKYE